MNSNTQSMRTQVRAALKASGTPMSPPEIANAIGAEVKAVRSIISRMNAMSEVTNVGDNVCGRYILGMGEAPKMPTIRVQSAEPYRPKHSTPARAGSMDAYALQSIEGGQAIDRVRPCIMSSRVVPLTMGR